MEKVDLKKYDNSWYFPGGLIKRVVWHIISSMFINSNFPLPVKGKIYILRLFGAKIGNGVMIKPRVNIKYPWFLVVEDYVWIGEEVWIDNYIEVKIMKNACISQGAMLLTGNHDFTKSTFDLIIKPITIGEGAWVGAKSIVCPGASLGDCAVLTVGSVATKQLSKLTVYQGNPAKMIKYREIKV